MAKATKSHLLASSAIIGLSMVQCAAAAQAQDSVAIRNDDPALLPVTVAQGETVTGGAIGVLAANGPITLDNAGTIRSNGVQADVTFPTSAVVFAAGSSSVSNSGTISGATSGVITINSIDPLTAAVLGTATDTSVTNSGTISGESNDAVRIVGGGTVTNSGTITGAGSPGADGISMFPADGQPAAEYSASVTNTATGTISGVRGGVFLSGGGDVDNAGAITGVATGVFIQGTPFDGNPDQERSGITASVINSGTINVTAPGAGQSVGVGFNTNMTTATLVNSGTITSAFSEGVNHLSLADLTITNEATGRIEGGRIGINSSLFGTLTVNNAGTIRGNGTGDSPDAPPGAGITIATADSSVTNTGTISGAGAGITTAFVFDTSTNSLVGLAVGTQITNSGTITGESNDGVRLIGGGSVVNSGTISGTGGPGADGVSMFPFTDQASDNYAASVDNNSTGSITGERFGVILSAGGDVTNAGAITGGTGGVFVQGTALNVAEGEDRSGQTASVTNTGTISGTGDFGFGGTDGYGVGFGGDLESAALVNAGTITSAFSRGVNQGSSGDLTITNEATGRIEGATSGIYGGSGGTMTIINAGTIRGNGNYDGFEAAPDAGINVATANSSVTNTGTISGAGAGITTAFVFDTSTNSLVGLAVGTQITNSGTITGESNDGVRLIGGGSVVNSGTISGTGGPGADGVSMFPFTDQASDNYAASVDNAAAGSITGERFGIILSAGGDVTNAGAITGGTGGVFVQGTALNVAEGEDRSGQTASVTNTGTISGTGDFGFGGTDGYGVGFGGDLESATLVNAGTITSAFGRGVSQGSLGDLMITNEATGRIEGATSGIYGGSGGTMTIINAGTIRGNGNYDGFEAAPDAGINVATANSSVTNTGTISGAGAGITTAFVFDTSTNSLVGLAVGTQITNSGTITGESNDGVRLIGGGSVVNSGTISGTGGPGADGVSMFPFTDQASDNYAASVDNAAAGSITGERFGIILSAGGDVTNAGAITGGTGGVFVQGTALNVAEGEDRSGQTASVTNTGTISGTGDFGFGGTDGYGVGFGGDLESATLVNAGTITSDFNAGVRQASSGDLSVTNEATGSIEGATSGVAVRAGSVNLVNEGTIRGNGVPAGMTTLFEGGVRLQAGDNIITNGGTISGAQFGVVTTQIANPETQALEWRIGRTEVFNSGTIVGELSDGVLLLGGGRVVNSGTIASGSGIGADGIQLQFIPGQDSGLERIGNIENLAGGTITGDRYGVILAGGGTIFNEGTITGGTNGALLVSQNFGGKTGLIDNLGTIEGGVLVDLDAVLVINSGTVTNANGAGLLSEAGSAQFEGALNRVGLLNTGVIEGSTQGALFTNAGATALTNSGAITGSSAEAIRLGLTNLGGEFANEATGVIEGATSGIVVQGGSIDLTNAGTIRGNGVAATLQAAPEAGLRLQAGDNTITNTGTISGAQYGIVTTRVFIPETQTLEWRVVRTQVSNSGTITGEANDGIILFGGGSVTNSGTISGRGNAQADGVQMQFFNGQDTSPAQIGSVVNEAGGLIAGDRYGVILAGGGSVDNAGTISGGTNGVLLVSQSLAGKTGSLDNSGTIEGGVLVDLASAVVTNTGTITNANGAGFVSEGGSVDFTNAGLVSGTGAALQFGAGDDRLTLLTGSQIEGVIEGGEGLDSLTLSGTAAGLTAAQELGETTGFESLAVASGYWNTPGFVGAFDTIAVAQGAALQVNEVNLGSEGLAASVSAPAITTNGTLVLNFSNDEALSQFAGLPIGGTGAVQLIGDGVLTVAADTLAYTGGTVISNGGLVLTGTLPGDVITEGDGFFQLGTGGTEGTFSGDLVNDGRFVFNRSDDYDFVGAFSGSGVLDKLGAGVLAFLGDYSFDGTTNILAGSVRIGGIIDPTTEFNLGAGGTLNVSGNDQTIAALSGEEESQVELGPQTLTIQQQNNTTFAGTIAGTGGISKDGDGVLNLTGNSTYTGPTTVNGGTLAVNGSIVSPVTVNAGGTLGGNGSVGNTNVSEGGRLAPGNSIGRLTVNGNLAFAAGSVYEVEVNAAAEADRVDATGAVTIASTAQMAVLAENGDYAPRTDYIIITGAEGVTGTFGAVTTDLAFLTPFLRYGADAVTLSLYRNDIDFAAVAANSNQAGVAGAVQALGINNPLFEAVLVQNAAGAQATFGELSGELHASAITGLTDDSRHLRNAMLGMPAPQQPGLFVWGSAFGGWGDFDGSAANFGMQTSQIGLVTGIGIGGEGFGVALSGGLGGSEFTLDRRADAADVASRYLALHGSVGAAGGFRGAAGLSYAWHDVETTRAVSGPLAQVINAQTDANTFQIFGEVGYEAMLGNTTITPFARIAHVSTDSDAFAEQGGAAALDVAGVDQNATFLSLGARAQFGASDAAFKPYASVAWNRVFGDREAVAVSRFASGGPAFSVSGLAIPKDSAEVDAGFEYTTGALRIGAGYTGTLASDRTVHGARVTARYAF